MEQLTIKELAPYLPYGLKCKTKKGIFELNSIKNSNIYKVWFETTNNHNNQDFNYKLLNELKIIGQGYRIKDIKPILRNLSDLDKEIEVNGEKFVPIDKLLEIAHCNITIPKTRMCLDDILYGYKENIRRVINEDMPLFVYNKLLEWHFDVFGLIKKGLAIDINIIK